ncbi:basic amino acid ABC transporter substrate-binding protein [Brachyspira aalborgi]|uniref:Basic amino acid ABC transporter substrate-binding protein n=1 Tax=Brachyspira aalborgi TaxID=29522 RepID=A0A5C8CKZ5_9SPIR|nr:basic amino acid ABC transporter substrate-binding protein [Brachyspira aalborgi]TXJ13605.1 basic amino acid ABC transporter substrate-binding protein [Brachyspira aalborgi]
MLKNSILKLIMISAIIFIAIIGCEKENKKLYVGTNAEFEPFEYREGENIVGFDIELIGEISKLINKDIEVEDMAFDGLLPALQTKKIDLIIAGMTATEERKKFVNFSESYYKSQQAIVVNKDENGINNFDNLIGKEVGVVLGYTGDIIVSEMTNVKVQRYNATSEAIMALKSKKVQAVVLDYEPAKNYSAQNPELKLIETDSQSEEYAIAIRKEDTQLLNDINKALATLKENGTYDALLNKYFK